MYKSCISMWIFLRYWLFMMMIPLTAKWIQINFSNFQDFRENTEYIAEALINWPCHRWGMGVGLVFTESIGLAGVFIDKRSSVSSEGCGGVGRTGQWELLNSNVIPVRSLICLSVCWLTIVLPLAQPLPTNDGLLSVYRGNHTQIR